MKPVILLCVLLCFFNETTSQVPFARTYGDSLQAEGSYTGLQTSDGGYILAGVATPSHYTIVKTDAAGDTLWTKNIPGKSIFGVQETSGGFIFTGGPHICLVKTDLTGSTLWTKSFSTNINPETDFGYSVNSTADGGYIITGQKNYNPVTFTGDICLIKTDPAGNQQWLRLLTTGLTDCAGRSVQQTADGGFIVGGYSNNQMGPFSNFDMCLIRTDTGGMIQWSKYFGSPPVLGRADKGYSVKQTADGGYILAGTYSETLSMHSYLVKTDANGDTVWTRTYGTPSQGFAFYSVGQTTDGGYVAAGESSSDLVFLKTDLNGDTLWTKIIDGSDFTAARYIRQTSDGGYAVIGFTAAEEFSDNHPNGYDHLLIKTDSAGNFPNPTVASVLNTEKESFPVLIFPNPFLDQLVIKNNTPAPLQFTLYSSMGQKITEMALPGKYTPVNLSMYDRGIYFYRLFSNNSVVRTGKLIKQ
jgi:hypothetical protein